MARPRTSTAILELKGSFKKHPERRRERAAEPKPPGPLGDPPAWLGLDRYEKETWKELQARLAPGVAGSSDIAAFATIVKIFTALRRDGIGGRAGLSSSMVSVMNALLSQFGMTPASRSKVSVPQADDDANPFLQLQDDDGLESIN